MEKPLRKALKLLAAVLFPGLVLAQGSRYLGEQAGIAVAVDGVMVLLFALYLLSSGGTRNAVP